MASFVLMSYPLAMTQVGMPLFPPQVQPSLVRGVTLHRLPSVSDPRGDLSVAELGRDLPFASLRCFMVFGVESSQIRGAHAHRLCHQFLIAARGSLRVTVDDGYRQESFQLDHPTLGLYLPPMIWGIQDQYSADAVLVVLASDLYDPADYIREYDEFCLAAKEARQPT